MKILAFDQASKTSGWSYFEDQKLIASGTFTVSGSLGERLTKIKKKIKELIIQYQPEKVLFEDIQLQDNVKNNVVTYKTLAEVIGVCEQLFTELKLQYEIIPSGVWRQGLSIAGVRRDIRKKNAQKYVLNTYAKEVSEDEADAICIGSFGIQQSSNKKFYNGGIGWSK